MGDRVCCMRSAWLSAGAGGSVGSADEHIIGAVFLPPFLLLYLSDRSGDQHCIALVRNLSALSLLVTVVVLVLNFMSAMGGEFLGNVLYYLLVIVSSPMICSGYWALSLFLWACLLTWSRKLLKKK